jgi:excisionase family DNA binding protein
MSGPALSERPPTENEVDAAAEAASLLGKAMTPNGLPISVEQNGDPFQVNLPAPLGQLMLDVLTHVGRGEMITLVPYGTELTTSEAADLLNVSRPFLIRLLEEGVIDHHKVGSHRRIRAKDLLAYKASRGEERSTAMTELQRLSQEFD